MAVVASELSVEEGEQCGREGGGRWRKGRAGHARVPGREGAGREPSTDGLSWELLAAGMKVEHRNYRGEKCSITKMCLSAYGVRVCVRTRARARVCVCVCVCTSAVMVVSWSEAAVGGTAD